MKYPEIDRLIHEMGLASDPSLMGTTFVLEPIPCDPDGCPLGLYDPRENTIILPPDFSEGALKHEIGHRYGHYYFNDLTEKYAEAFRQKYSNGTVLLLESKGMGDMDYGSLFEEGERGALVIAYDHALTSPERTIIQQHVSPYPSVSAEFYRNKAILMFTIPRRAQKAFPPLILPIVLVAGALGLGGVIGYGLFKIASNITESVASNLVPLALIAAGAFITIAWIKKPA